MSKTIVNDLKASFVSTQNMLLQCIEVCPDDLWAKKISGWPLWQELYHAFSTIDYFVLQPGEEPAQPPLPHDAAALAGTPDATPDKTTIKAFGQQMQKRAEAYFDRLQDADLGAKNEGFSARRGMDMTHTNTMVLLSAHGFYHLGACDTALRQAGLKGII